MAGNEIALRDIAWRFTGGPFSDRASFDVRLKQYQEEFDGSQNLEPGEIAILSPVIRIQYACRDGDKQIEPVVTLTAENGAAFSVGDLLFQLHNAVVERLEDMDHHFFEGLALITRHPPRQPPLYRLCQGS